jgi:alpha-beta hydrolase superfamily lysophospholipase
MARSVLAALAAALVLVGADAPASTLAKQDVFVPMDDGVSIAASLYLPDASPPAEGWPAIVLLHGFGGSRQELNALVETSPAALQTYAVLTLDARGHGASGGLVGVAGPREVADVRAVRDWLAARADVSDTRIAAWGISYGGGTALNSLVAGVPWGAVVAFEAWTDLDAALMPQGLVKSGLVSGLAASIPLERQDPSLIGLFAAALAGRTSAVRPWAQERSSASRLGAVTTPVFVAQGRRDFLFGLDQGTLAFQRLRGPKVLYVGLHGHHPSTFPAADTGALVERARAWLDCQLRGQGCEPATASVYVAPESFRGQVVRRGTLPPVSPTFLTFPGVTTFAQRGKAVRTSARLQKALEIFGSPTVSVGIGASGGWSRLVAVLTARTPQGRELVVSAGGIPTRNGASRVTIRMISQATYVPRGSRLTLTLASSSTAQAGGSPVYLDLPMLRTARLRVGAAALKLPALRSPVTR